LHFPNLAQVIGLQVGNVGMSRFFKLTLLTVLSVTRRGLFLCLNCGTVPPTLVLGRNVTPLRSKGALPGGNKMIAE